jgi:hypothetical protein
MVLVIKPRASSMLDKCSTIWVMSWLRMELFLRFFWLSKGGTTGIGPSLPPAPRAYDLSPTLECCPQSWWSRWMVTPAPVTHLWGCQYCTACLLALSWSRDILPVWTVIQSCLTWEVSTSNLLILARTILGRFLCMICVSLCLFSKMWNSQVLRTVITARTGARAMGSSSP